MLYLVVMVFLVLLGAITLSYQIYQMIYLDAKCRGLKHPAFWGFFSMSGNNGSGGLILYLLGRKKYPLTMSEIDRCILNTRKKKALVSLCFLMVGTLSLVLFLVIGNYH